MEFQKQFYKKIRTKWYKVFLSILSGIGRSVLMLIPTLLMRNIYNSLESDLSIQKIVLSAVFTFLIPLIVMVLFIVDIRMSKYIFEIIKEIRIQALRDILNFKLKKILTFNYGELFSNLIQSLSQIGDYYYYTLNTLTWYATACIVGVILMLYINFYISLIILLITSLQIVCVLLMRKFVKRAKEEENKIHAEGTDYTLTLLSQNAFIKVAQREKKEMDMAQDWIKRSWRNTKRKIRNEQVVTGITFLITTTRALYLFFAVHTLFLSNSMMKGDFIALNSYIIWLTPIFLGFQDCLRDAIVSQINKKRINRFILDSNEENSTQAILPDTNIQTIVVKNLSFAYTDSQKKLLNNFNLECNYGEALYVVGESGSGKSTLLNILMNLEDAYTGDTFINRYNIKDLNEKWLHSNIVLVGQDVDILPTTLRENLLYSGVAASDEELIQALEALKLEHLLSMPGGLDWDMKAHPRILSDGEKKRIAILRAVLSKPRVLLLDEPTAGLDNINKINVMKYIGQCISGILIVATHDVIYKKEDKIIRVGE